MISTPCRIHCQLPDDDDVSLSYRQSVAYTQAIAPRQSRGDFLATPFVCYHPVSYGWLDGPVHFRIFIPLLYKYRYRILLCFLLLDTQRAYLNRVDLSSSTSFSFASFGTRISLCSAPIATARCHRRTSNCPLVQQIQQNDSVLVDGHSYIYTYIRKSENKR